MDEQSPNERQRKVRRSAIYDAEDPRPGAMHAESTGQAEPETPATASQKPSRDGEAGEEVSRATKKDARHVESGLRWSFQATQHAVDEWTHFFGRTLERNSRAAGDLRACDSVSSAFRCQWDLVQSNVEDWLETSIAVFGSFCAQSSHAKKATETAGA